MKLARRILSIVSTLAILGSVSVLRAADPLQVAPDMYKLVYENERVRVMEVTFQPGQKIAEHSHPDHYIYVLEGGTLDISHSGGAPMAAVLKVGDVVWIPAETHWAVNSGKTKVRLLVNELKEPAPMKKTMTGDTKK